MMLYYLLYGIFALVWIMGVYLWFNRKKSVEKSETSPSDMNIIAMPDNAPKIRIVFDQTDSKNLDIKSLADFTVRYADLLSGNYTLPNNAANPNELLTGKDDVPAEHKSTKAADLDLSDYVNILTIKI